jgi:predicted XRE-type DNA-binding protein
MSNERFANIWDAIEDTPAQAENMKLRAPLMLALRDHIEREGLSQSQAAKLLAVTQPRISDLMRGKIGLFAIDTLVNMLASAGLGVEMRIGVTRVQREKVARPTRRATPSRTARRTSRPAAAPQRTKSARPPVVA